MSARTAPRLSRHCPCLWRGAQELPQGPAPASVRATATPVNRASDRQPPPAATKPGRRARSYPRASPPAKALPGGLKTATLARDKGLCKATLLRVGCHMPRFLVPRGRAAKKARGMDRNSGYVGARGGRGASTRRAARERQRERAGTGPGHRGASRGPRGGGTAPRVAGRGLW